MQFIARLVFVIGILGVLHIYIARERERERERERAGGYLS